MVILGKSENNLHKKLLFSVIILFMLAQAVSFAQTNKQTVRGEVYDSDSHEPLVGATVIVLESDPILGASSDLEGKFHIDGVSMGRYDLSVSYVGYETRLISGVMVTAGKEVVLQIPLQQSIMEMSEVVISADVAKEKPQNSMAYISARTFSVEETHRYAGGLDDPARMVASFAGVTTSTPQDNAIFVRGNAPQGVAWQLEGVEIPTPHHFVGANVTDGGIVTLFSSQMMANSDFYTAAFPAEYGNALAAVFDMKFRTGNNSRHEHAVQVGMLGIDIASEGPFSKKYDGSYLFNYRYSTFGLLTDLKVIDTTQKFKYQDLSFKFNFPTRRYGTFSLWGIGGVDSAIQPLLEDKSKWKYDFDRVKFTWDTYQGTLGLGHKIVTGSNSYIHSTAAFSGIRNDMLIEAAREDYTLYPVFRQVDDNGTFTLTSALNHKFNAQATTRAGFTYKYMFYDMDLSASDDAYSEAMYGPVAEETGNANSIEGFAQLRYRITPELTFNGGLHLGYFKLNDEFTLEPRFGLRWQVHPKHSFNLGYGMHSRPENLKMYLMQFDGEAVNHSLKLSKAHHAVLGYDWSINKKMRLSTELYYQHLYDIPGEEGTSFSLINYKQDYTLHKAMINNTIGRNTGIDITFERFLNNNYYYLLTASIFDSKYKGGDNKWHNTRYNRSYAFNALYGKEFFFKNNSRSLGLNIRANFTGGECYSPVLEEESHAVRRIITDEVNAFSKQFDPLLYFDATVTYRINHKKSSSHIALQVKNILGAALHNSSFSYNLVTDEIELVKTRVVIPVLSYKYEF